MLRFCAPFTTMKLIIKFFPEITIKTRPVRKRFVSQLKANLRLLLPEADPQARLTGGWDSLEVVLGDDPVLQARAIARLRDTPGIAHFVEVRDYPLQDLNALADLCVAQFGEQVRGKVFAVRCKRVGRHDFSSQDVAQRIGQALMDHCGARGVSLKSPDVWVRLEIREQTVWLLGTRHQGLGGFPLGTMEPVLSLLSGGFDSTIASYRMLQRGLLPHFVFFNLGGRAHELGVRQVAHHLWQRYAASHRLRFVSVPFDGVVAELLQNVENSQMGVVLKRMMLRAANRVARRLDLDALVTGEAIAQVASQTLPNLAVIDQASELLVLRPLITTSKTEIIDTARAIGTYDFAASMPEYCGVISINPAIRTTPREVAQAEQQFDFAVLEAAIENAHYLECRDLLVEPEQSAGQAQLVSAVLEGEVVLDIRSADEQEANPLSLDGTDVVHVPFYQLSGRFAELDAAKTYLLYCDRGVMSRLHAQYLLDAGHRNLKVLRPAAG
jgi:tRNA uracil 4-sulfurtransferase